MSWSMRVSTARETGPEETMDDANILLQRVNLAVFATSEPITITVNPDADGGWGEAPQPTITWVAPDGTPRERA